MTTSSATDAPSETATQTTGNAPTLKAKHGVIDLACWPEERSNREGEVRTYRNVQISQSFKNKDDVWEERKLTISDGNWSNFVAAVADMDTQFKEHQANGDAA